ncbi:restriction endonuclease subunit S [Acinetobacter haemolyticus]|uniref:restriction endonuclease subunit S n=1 Tax=Acinetobacter haemolyticus TaxID=29430 RepID=UPI0009492826|nr:restriction endonuclease subunit S [Acinetobacter haemolyticus]APR69107.1 hypothetical protein AHTJS_00985 [Acinetobacter haemolyticus]
MAKYQKYAEYKDSGIEWLGEIPSHWDVKRLGSFFEERREKVSDVDYPALSVTKNGIVPQLDTAAKTDAGDNRKLVKVNDFVINSRSDRKGSSGISPYTGSVSLISIVMEPHRIYPAYAHHLLRSYPFQEEFYRYGKGIVADLWSTNSSEMKNILLPDIPIIEQQKIASFLEHETAKIDTLIAKQEKLIELLKEKRQAVISHAVTKGLNPNVPMKDSGVEWLGEVPEHWKVAPIKRIIHLMEQGKSPECENISATSEQWGVLKTSCVNNGIFHSQQNKALPEHIKPHIQYQVKAGDVLMSRASGSINLIGSVALVPNDVQENLLLSDKIFRIHLTKDCDSRFFTLLMATPYMRTLIERAISGAEGMANNITKTAILDFVSAIPPLKEQVELVDYLTQKIQVFDSLVVKASQAIEVMQERRTALISAAVTGKIDVRNWQNPNKNNEVNMELSA